MEQFQLTDDLIIKISDLISAKNNSTLKKLVKNVHFADMADVINILSEEQGIYLIKLFDSEKTSEILTELDENVREKILKALSVKEIADEIEELDSDDAADILSELSEERKEEVISEISDDELADDNTDAAVLSELDPTSGQSFDVPITDNPDLEVVLDNLN